MELIKDRLAHIVRAKNLTATQFAEMMQIQPSNVSHLLSGRNKPSLDFLIKLKEIFPEYNFDWIILGKKPITVSDRTSLVREDVFDPIGSLGVKNDAPISKMDDAIDNVDRETTLLELESKSEGFTVSGKMKQKVKQIVYVYEDNTFEIYNMRM